MDPKLLAYYDRELRYLRELGGEFAAEFPKVAARLGLDSFECSDPYVERLLEGFAFMAARVQLKIDAEFPRFTEQLLDALCPHYLGPTPSMAVVQLRPDPKQGALNAGFVVPRATAIRGNLRRGESTACEFRTAHEVTLWPIEVTRVTHAHHGAELAPIQPAWRGPAKASLRLVLRTTNEQPFSALPIDRLVLYVRGSDAPSLRLLEALLGTVTAVSVRPSDSASAIHVPEGRVEPVGLDDDQALLPAGPRSFQGYRLLQEYFAFPARLFFAAIAGLRDALRRCTTPEVEIVLALDRHDAELEAGVDATRVALFCTPAVNLFPKRADRIALTDRDHELHVVADRTRPMDFEVHSVVDVAGIGARGDERREFAPLYGRVARHGEAAEAAFFTVRRAPRNPSSSRRGKGPRLSYLGGEVFLSLADGSGGPFRSDLQQLAVSTLCTNRDLTLRMPVGQGRTDFVVEAGAPVESVRCLAGPSLPRPSHAWGDTSWRLISHLSLNYLSLADSDDGKGATALRELLGLYSDLADAAVKRHIEGVRSATARPVVRRLPLDGPTSFARGVELTVECDEHAFEGTSTFALGLVLDRFFERYVSINSFVETVLRSTQRGEVARWAPRIGRRPANLSWLERLARDPGGFDFHVALRRFESTFAEAPRLGEATHARDEPLRLGQSPELGFEPTSLARFFPADPAAPSGGQGVPKLHVAFLGLWGPHGPLPLHLTEYARDRARNAGDRTLAAFVDVFHHRMILLFHRAWAAAQPSAARDRAGDDRFAKYVAALMGLALPSTHERDALPDQTKLFFAGRFAPAPRSCDGLADVVAGALEVPARVQPFIGTWLDVPPSDRWRLGGAPTTGALGRTAVLGARVWTRTQKFRIVLGPMDAGRLDALLPGGRELEELSALVRLYTNDEWEWDLHLKLDAERGAPLALGKGARLGWSTRIGVARGERTDLLVDPRLARTTRLSAQTPTG